MSENESQPDRVAEGGAGLLIGGILFLLPLLLAWCLIGIWPIQKEARVEGLWGWLNGPGVSAEVRLMLVVMVAGALGSSIHAAKSFATFHGLKRWDDSWRWWYVLRLPTGMGLALLMYLLIRGGLFSMNATDQTQAVSTVNPFGFAGLAALVGMFAKQATEKMEELFENLLAVKEQRSPAAPKPSVAPGLTVKVPSPPAAVDLTIPGENFDADATATIGGKSRTIAKSTPTSLVVKLEAEDVAAPGDLALKIANPKEKGGGSVEAVIKVIA